MIVSLETGEQTVLLAGSTAQYVSTGHLVYWREGSLWAVPFDTDQLTLSGPSVLITEGVPATNEGLALFAVDGGLLAHQIGASGLRTLVWVDREGNEELVAAEPRPYAGLALSPDGGRAVLQVDEPENIDLVIYDLVRDTPTRFTFDPGADRFPVWTPDGERVVFTSERDGGLNLYWKAADGTGRVDRLTTSVNLQVPAAVSPDGTTLLFVEAHPETSSDFDLGALSLDGEQAVDWLLESDATETLTDLSPDGRWVAYASNESGQDEVYVRPFPNVDDDRWQISRDGGVAPLWGPDSREVFFQTDEGPGSVFTMMAAVNDTAPTFSPGIPRPLFDGPYHIWSFGVPRPFDVSPDGQRFLMIKTVENPSSGIAVVANWFEELTRLVPVP